MKYYAPAAWLLLCGLVLSGWQQHDVSAALLRSEARRRVVSRTATVDCTYGQGTILGDDESGDQTGSVKHLCVTAETGSVYAIPDEAVVTLEEAGLLFTSAQFVINGARIVASDMNHDPDDQLILDSEWSIDALFEGDRRLLHEGSEVHATGTDTVIVARVTATDSVVSYSSAQLQQFYFGTDQTSVALQYNRCSAGEYSLAPKPQTTGIVELKWNFPSNGVDVGDSIENSLRQAFESAHGSTENYDHVIYCLPGGFNSFRGYTNSETNEIWIYNEWCGYLSLPFHEIGRNLGLEISNGADGAEFGDRSGMMGVSYATPFAPSMCFNGHKFWILDWFSSYQMVVDPSVTGATSIDLAAFVDVQKLPTIQRPYGVVVNVGNLYLVYNLAKNYNLDTKGNANQVTITEGPNLESASKSLGGIDASSTSFAATTTLNSGANQKVIIEFCALNMATSSAGRIDAMRISIRTESQSRTCEVIDAPSAVPSQNPSSSPSKFPGTAFPTPSAFLCDDTDGSFFVPGLGREEQCIWLRARPALVPGLCTAGSQARRVCPETCGACTDECDDTQQQFAVEGVLRDCEWLRIRPGQQTSLCIVGNDAYNACPETCDACDGRDVPSLSPSASPSSNPSSKGDTKSPTTSPSESPAPTIRQTASPSTLACDDDPDRTFLVPSRGTTEPCIWLADRPTFQLELCVKGLPAYDICEETCGKCTDNCEDTEGSFTISGTQRDCEWLRLRPGIQSVVCIIGSEATSVCPETCNACEGSRNPTTSPAPSTPGFCDDDPSATFPVPSLGTNEPCIWLADRPALQAELCKGPAFNTCAETCGKCTDNCRDTFGTFKHENVNRDCQWLKLRTGVQQVVCVPGNAAYTTVCPETCNSCDAERFPSASPHPSSSPSESPRPSPLPSLNPTTDVICDDDPDTRFPVPSLGTNEPCFWLADRPQFKAELCVKGNPAYDLCEETCGKCSDDCMDTFGSFKIDGVDRDCDWLRLRRGIQLAVCVVGNEAYTVCPETCNACDGRTVPPSRSPSTLPSRSPSAQPSQSPSLVKPTQVPTSTQRDGIFCDDDLDQTFFVESNNERQGCIWLQDRLVFQLVLCVPGHPSGAYDICEETCRKCSDTCDDTSGKFAVDGIDRDCEWLRLRRGQQDVLCIEGSIASSVCPETCNTCDQAVAPSRSPSASPSLSPSVNQAVAPSRSPSTSQAPTSKFCDDTSGDFFTSITGKREPCIWLEDRPQFIAQLCTAGSEASTVCPETCGVCKDNCEDTTGNFALDGNSRNCEYLKVRPGLVSTVCIAGSEAYRVCPETCDACDGKPASPCDDTGGDFFTSITGKREPCIWLQARPDAITAMCTAGSEASTTCPETCGVCQDNCEDTDAKFLVGTVSRDCEWLRVRPGEQAVLCSVGGGAYTACPETCNVCD